MLDHIWPSYCCCSSPLFRIHFKILATTYKAFNNHVPAYILDLASPLHNNSSLRSYNKVLLALPRTCLKTKGDRAQLTLSMGPLSVGGPKGMDCGGPHVAEEGIAVTNRTACIRNGSFHTNVSLFLLPRRDALGAFTLWEVLNTKLSPTYLTVVNLLTVPVITGNTTWLKSGALSLCNQGCRAQDTDLCTLQSKWSINICQLFLLLSPGRLASHETLCTGTIPGTPAVPPGPIKAQMSNSCGARRHHVTVWQGLDQRDTAEHQPDVQPQTHNQLLCVWLCVCLSSRLYPMLLCLPGPGLCWLSSSSSSSPSGQISSWLFCKQKETFYLFFNAIFFSYIIAIQTPPSDWLHYCSIICFVNFILKIIYSLVINIIDCLCWSSVRNYRAATLDSSHTFFASRSFCYYNSKI